MATVEVVAPVGLIASEEEQLHAVEEAIKVTEIKPMTEKAFEEEAHAAEEIVDESPTVGENSTENFTVTSPSLEPEAESAQVKVTLKNRLMGIEGD